jgi:hypothetical protein
MHKLMLLIYGAVRSGVLFNAKFAAARVDFQDGI